MLEKELRVERLIGSLAKAVVLAVCLGGLQWCCEVSAEVEQIPCESDGLRIGFEVHKNVFLAGEPLIVSLRLTNTGSEKAVVSSRLNDILWQAPVYFDFADSAGRSGAWEPPVHSDGPLSREPRVLQPGEYVEARYNLAVSSNPVGMDRGPLYWTCPKPGQYTLTARYSVSKGMLGRTFWLGTIQSEAVSFEIREPKGIDRQAFDVLNKTAVMWYYSGIRKGSSRVVREMFQRVITEFPTSRYAIYAEFYLADRLLPYEEAIPHMRRFISEHPDFILVPDGEFLIADMLFRSERFDDARGHLAAASAKYPNDAHTLDRFATIIRDPSNDERMSAARERKRRYEEQYGTIDEQLEQRQRERDARDP